MGMFQIETIQVLWNLNGDVSDSNDSSLVESKGFSQDAVTQTVCKLCQGERDARAQMAHGIGLQT